MNALKGVAKFTWTRSTSLMGGSTLSRLCSTGIETIALRPKKRKDVSSKTQCFVDTVQMNAIGGKGGDGCISFLRIYANDHAGPDGGDGGNGGHVIFKASTDVHDLSHLPKVVRAAQGERGYNRDCTGKSAKNEYLKVPIGTIIRNQQGIIVGDLNQSEAKFIAARGGSGGRGNHFFVSDTVQAPEVAELGALGENLRYTLEVKSMAHIGLVGMPNAGKSTLLRAITRARPMVASYAFTTLKPHIGKVQYSDHEQIAVADLPGLVEGSHKNEGLGIEFLKHAERCSGLLFMIDLSVENPIRQYEILRYEISQFSKELSTRPHVIAGNKMDLVEAKNNFPEFRSKVNQPIIGISAKTGKNLLELLSCIRELYDNSLRHCEGQ